MLVAGAAVGAGVTYVGVPHGTVNSGLCASGSTITIGELLDLSKDLSSQGVRAKISSLIAINDINSLLSSGGCNLKFAVAIDDYQLDDTKGLTDLQAFAASGVQVVVGPLNSGTAQAILGYANSHHIVLISPSSTAPQLGIANDYLFRTAPNDANQGHADARILLDRGATAVIIVQRHDTYGDGLANATAAYFKQLGASQNAKVVDTISYDKSTTDFSAILSKMDSDYTSANTGAYLNHVAIYAVSFEEFGTMIIQAHNNYPTKFPWSPLPWFGTDGEAQDAVIINATTSGPYVSQVKLPSTLFSQVNNAKTVQLNTTFTTQNPSNICDSYCLGAYDDVWLAALSTLQAGAYDGTKIQTILPTVAANYYGVTGWCGLQASGDRVPTGYQVWKVVTPTGGKPGWVLAGEWDFTTDTVTWTSVP
jgi:branched-chain amino acid transport system substrate-binding protein